MKRIALPILLLAFASAAAAQIPASVKSAFDAVDLEQDKWAYTKTSVENGSRSVERFDPSRPEGQQWELVTKDGRVPDKAERADYAREKQERKAKRRNGGDPKDLSKMIRPGSLRLVRETAAEAMYEFRLPADDDDAEGRAVVDTLKGRLTIVKDGPWLRVLEIDNEKPIKPVIAVRIDRMYTKMTFRPPGAGLPALLGEVRAIVRGRALMVKKIDVDALETYTDYRRVLK